MALPKRQHSKARTAKRRATWRVAAPNLGSCPKCHQPKLPHHACPSCGYYSARVTVKVKEKKEHRPGR